MNKAELVKAMAEKAGTTQKDTAKVLEAFTSVVTETIASDEIHLVGFGTFKKSERAARTGRNPQTGTPISIPATVVPKFKAGKDLKEAVALKGKGKK